MGDAPRAGRFAGFNPSLVTIMVLGISGAAAGLAGMVEVSANIGQLQPDISFGYGFTAIIVAFLARLNPLAVIAAGLIVALAELGGIQHRSRWRCQRSDRRVQGHSAVHAVGR